ncbi:class I SAM-dependent methyltransferase [Botrimarina colliarenosi]|nr:class I SAM-dependent methyltransferase [Botrimarina colliarenosi]
MKITQLVRRLKQREFFSSSSRQKLLRGIEGFANLPNEQLRDVEVIANLIRGIGLRYDARGLYGEEARYMNATTDGLWQLPLQLANALVVLADQEIKTFLEVGTHSGFTGAVITAYLHRLQPGLQALTIDPFPSFRNYELVRQKLPLEYRRCTTSDLMGETFDCVLIDGDHSYEAVKRDYEIVGRTARVCLFHDIDDDLSGHDNVPRFWRELVSGGDFDQTYEFTQSPPGKRVMGIGVGVRHAA